MYALYEAVTGRLVSVGSVVAVPLPDGLAAVDLGTDDRILTGYGYWDTPTRSVLDVIPNPREQADAERARIETNEAILDAIRATASAAHTDGQPWVQPTGAHDAYPLDITVTHGGKTWESLIAFNVHEPGLSGWRERSADGGRAAWVQPAGAHDAYQVDAEVTHNGRAWLNTYPSNTYEPGVYGWTDAGPA